MKELLFDYFSAETSEITFQVILLNFLISTLMGLIIYVSYRFSHSGPVYSARFNVSLVMLTIVTTLVMAVIGNNVALSLGMVGALSIVRFRTAIKDPRDTVYIFWCIAVGICCGVSEYFIAAVGSAIIFLFLVVFGRVQRNDRYLLIVRADQKKEEEVSDLILLFFKGKAIIRAKNLSGGVIEMIYELSSGILARSEQNESITNKLSETEGVYAVNLVCQNDEVNR
ncbi:MAG TPA: DUF4956 domain-containing protein [Oscillospiraceae bacterium]|nr:DUF4956 domain-containing protein [Oscillospiraceae bacterium]HRW56701.1 DUF4956 domain-containing protein [Oscillospiraceae bacterium]